uniref:Ribosomal protein L14 n=1 Tax=Pseudo-nitzschia multiseries TaxID=37319 RepID=A0A0G3F663_PSEMU|nr:ribosomal protein L14 [Pseudo-nitzschia multiseries]AKJ77349.1 ribosomal protein L14 [Pseudo-nitzschia multiseries]
MIQQQTILKVADNSGAKTVKCIKVLGGFKKRYANLGDIIVVSVQQLRNKSKKTSKVLKGGVFRALVVRTKTQYRKKDGSSFTLNENSVTLINKQGNPIGTRILGPIPKILKKKNLWNSSVYQLAWFKMNPLENYYKKVIRYDLINKFFIVI